MGCDIHTMVEVKDYRGVWVGSKIPIFEYPYFNKAFPVSEYNKPYMVEPYSGRDYALFGRLAGVRYESIPALSEPRGVPEDASRRWKKYVKKWGQDLHSTSFFTLDELLDENWDGTEAYDVYGYVSLTQWDSYKAFGKKPESWYEQLPHPSESITSSEYDRRRALREYIDPTTLVHGFWRLGINFPEFQKTIDTMLKLAPFRDKVVGPKLIRDGKAAERDTSKVRLVFGFDN